MGQGKTERIHGIRCTSSDVAALKHVLGALGLKYADWLLQTIHAQSQQLSAHGTLPKLGVSDTPELQIRQVVALAATYASAGDNAQRWVVDQMLRTLLGSQYPEWVAAYNNTHSADWQSGEAP